MYALANCYRNIYFNKYLLAYTQLYALQSDCSTNFS